jgi:hypothetical protein
MEAFRSGSEKYICRSTLAVPVVRRSLWSGVQLSFSLATCHSPALVSA